MMIKSGNSITTNLLMEKPTNEKNGVEVTIKNITSFNKYINALNYIVFFPNIYIDGVSTGDVINKAKLKKFNNFAASSVITTSKALLGNVLYPIDKTYFKGVAHDFLTDIQYSGIVIKFNVGELNITPNRENIIYTSDTINKIEKRILSAKKEIEALVGLVIKKNFDDILEYADYIRSDLYYNPIENTIDRDRSGYPITIKSFDIKYKNINLVNYVYSIRNILESTLPNFKGLIYDDKIITKRYNYYSTHYRISSSSIIMLDKGVKLSPVLKSYLKDNYNNYGIMTYITKEEFIKRFDSYDFSASKDFILSGIYESMMKRATRLNVDTDSDFLKYKADNSKKGTNVKEDKEVILHVVDWRRDKYKFDNFSEAVDFIKNKHKGIMLTTMETDDNIVGTIAQLKGYICIKAKKDVVADIKALNLKCLVDVDWLMNKDPMFSIVKTLLTFFPDGIHYTTIEALKEINYELYKLYERFKYFHNHYGGNYIYKCLSKRDSIPIDDYTKKFCEDMRNFIDKYTEAKNEVREAVGAESNVLTTALLVKTKAYRVSYKAYNKVKNNKILNVLCRK